MISELNMTTKQLRSRSDKIIVFGAGKIGRSFIGQLFSAGGYEVIFIDKNDKLIDELNTRGSYNVIIKDDSETTIKVENVRGLKLHQTDEIVNEISSINLVAVSTGPIGYGSVISLIAQGLIKRGILSNNSPLDVILAENLRNASAYFEMELKKELPGDFPFEIKVGLIETSIGKMVPIMHKKDVDNDILQVFAESYNTLIVDKMAFKNPIPKIEGLAPEKNIKAWVDRKLFIHNLGHASSAYIGYLYNPNLVYVYEALEVPEIFNMVRNIMLQSADVLLKMYPEDFTDEFLTRHIDDLLKRFRNRSLGDTIFRVGCDLCRKLGPGDRITGCIKLAMEQALPYNKVLLVLICACRFKARDEAGNLLKSDLVFDNTYKGNIKKILAQVCGFDPEDDKKIFEKAIRLDLKLRNSGLIDCIRNG